GAKISDGWSLAAANLPSALRQYGEMLSKPAALLASFAGGLSSGGLSFVLSIAIAAEVFLEVLRGEGFAKPNPRTMFPNPPGL
ncbi:hypothetical protein ACC758_39085, partial [Rhizobium ruizarguesonis]